MANEKSKTRTRKVQKSGSAVSRARSAAAPAGFTLTGRNYLALAGALACILLGFLLLSRGSITAAPILLVLGYCVLVPYGLAAGRSRRTADAPADRPLTGE